VPWFWSNQGTLKLQMVGRASGPGENVVRGDENRFSVFRMSDGLLAGVESFNDPGTHMAARRLLARVRPTGADLVDADFDVRVLARRAMAAETAGTGAV
jgi:3-phenylpropionate/trans-cinnamate dioxygenase ferredoxin reductase subunit